MKKIRWEIGKQKGAQKEGRKRSKSRKCLKSNKVQKVKTRERNKKEI
jgi:hypothetical protein